MPVELRGAGQSTRQVTNFFSPDVWSDAEELMCVEVLTPDGNWSSYPPHKHDDSAECPAQNEEIYYFRIGRAGETDYAQDGFGLHRLYTGTATVRSTRPSRSATATCSSSPGATTGRAWPPPATRCTT